jgi:hypothetical protein
MVMSDRQARLQAVSEWLMEFSVLWAVFPILDLLIEEKPLRAGLIVFSLGICFVAAARGILLTKGDSK